MHFNQIDSLIRSKFPKLLASSIIMSVAVVTPALGTPIDSAMQFADNGHYYEVFTTLRTWDNARWAAEQMGGYLASITTQAENDFVTSLLPPNLNAWLGGFQPPGSSEPAGNWQWITGEAFTYMNWNTGEPNNGVGWGITDEKALEIYGILTGALGKWNDARPDVETYGYVVEYDTIPQGIPEPPAPLVAVPDTSNTLSLLCIAFLIIVPAGWSGRQWRRALFRFP